MRKFKVGDIVEVVSSYVGHEGYILEVVAVDLKNDVITCDPIKEIEDCQQFASIEYNYSHDDLKLVSEPEDINVNRKAA